MKLSPKLRPKALLLLLPLVVVLWWAFTEDQEGYPATEPYRPKQPRPPLPSMISVIQSQCQTSDTIPSDGLVSDRRCAIDTALRYCHQALEVGGPSSVFREKHFHVYKNLDTLDNVQFSRKTLWQDRVDDTFFWYPNKVRGYSIITDAEDLSPIANETYDAVMSAHNIEHLANPLKALREQVRVLRPGGALIVVAPNKEEMFDHRRPTTTFEHLLSDLEKNTGADDLTHLPEILELHDYEADQGVKSREEFHARSLKNAENRALHHHVFDRALMVKMFKHFGVEPLYHESFGVHGFMIGVKRLVCSSRSQ